MTPSEFKAWFEGYAEGIEDAPSVKQWARIKERVAEIDGRATPATVFRDRYVPYYEPHRRYWYAATAAPQAGVALASNNAPASGAVCTGENLQNADAFNALSAFARLGRADAALDA